MRKALGLALLAVGLSAAAGCGDASTATSLTIEGTVSVCTAVGECAGLR